MDSLSVIKNAWVRLLFDFRAELVPETPLLDKWKGRAPFTAIRASQGRMIDDVEEMLKSYREEVGEKVGENAVLPVMITAVAPITSPPTATQVIQVPYFIDTEVNGIPIKLRLVSKSIRCQIAFFSTNPHDVNSLADQFCTYMLNEDKRRFPVNVPLISANDKEKAITAPFFATVFENELYPSEIPTTEKNLSVVVIDVTLVMPYPYVQQKGLSNVGAGASKNGQVNTQMVDFDVITDADADIQENGKTVEKIHAHADKTTKEKTVTFEKGN